MLKLKFISCASSALRALLSIKLPPSFLASVPTPLLGIAEGEEEPVIGSGFQLQVAVPELTASLLA